MKRANLNISLNIAAVFLICIIFCSSCTNNGFNFWGNSNFVSADTTITFMWTEDVYNEESQATHTSMVINEQFCAKMSNPERAALGYVATFIGNECDWDGESKDDGSNLKCIIISALDLGYQCSDEHLGFLRKWFRNDENALMELKTCSGISWSATNQSWFEEITITTRNDTIVVWFSASAFSYRSAMGASWTETNYFKVDNNTLTLVKVDESEVERYGINRKGNNQ